MELLRQGDAGFEQACTEPIFNARRPDRRPLAVLRAASEADVVAGVRLARDEGLRVAVRSGGHSWAAWSLREDSLLIDLGELRELGFDASSGVATASPSIRGGTELAPFLHRHARAFPAGHCPTVGLGGYLLQGGQGWNSRCWGWACENVVGVDVVTADGELLHADETENADLLWAARGSGPGFFAVITRFHLRTHALPRSMTHDTWMFEMTELEPLLEWLHELLPRLESVVEPVVAATRLPFADRPVLLLHTTALCDSSAEVAKVLEPLNACPIAGRAISHARGPTTIAEENEAQGRQSPENHRYAADCTWTDASAAELAPLLRELWTELPTRHSFSIWYGWSPTRQLPDMAFSIEGNVYLATYAIWDDPADDERHSAWCADHARRLATLGKGVHLGDTDFTRRSDRFLSDENFRRLQEIRARRDPEGLFCSYLAAPGAELNADPNRRRRTGEG
jgi:FAD/FMN-containing dehydrogenase